MRPGRSRRSLRDRLLGVAAAAEVDREIEHHLRELADRLEAEGFEPVEARREAERRFGDRRWHREELVKMSRRGEAMRKGMEGWSRFVSEVAYAIRGLRRNPRFSVGVLATFGLGIGMNGAMFTIADRLLLRPPEHVVEPTRSGGSSSSVDSWAKWAWTRP